MARGRRKVAAPAGASSPAVTPAVAAPVAPERRRKPRSARRGTRALLGLASVLAVTAVGLVAKRCGSSPALELRAPVTLDQAPREVRAHVEARLARAREAPNDPARIADLGLALAANGFWNEARPVFEHLARLTPDDALPAYYVAECHSRAGDAAAARLAFEALVTRFPKFPQGRFRLGLFLLDDGAFDAAKDVFTKQVEIEGDASVWGRLGLGVVLLQTGKPEQAVATLEPVVRREPGLAQGNYLLGLAYRGVKRLDDAARHLQRGIHAGQLVMPDPWGTRLANENCTVSGRIDLAQKLHDAGRTTDAIALLEQARPSYPDDVELLSNLGAMYVGAGQLDKAREALDHAARANANHVPTLYNLTVVELRAGNLDSALAYARKAVELAPALAHSHVMLADVLDAKGRVADAIPAAREAIRIDPRNASIRLRAATILAKQGRNEEARTELLAASRIDPGNAQVWLLLCEVCVRLKLVVDARAALEEARRLTPQAPQVPVLARMVAGLEGS
jgi:tetratricopeptide (TPR) repeat protein